jgi:Patched family
MMVRSLEEVDEQAPGLPLDERFRRMLRAGGMSITVTSLTNCAAFLFGSITSIPAIRWCALRAPSPPSAAARAVILAQGGQG